MPVMPSVRLTHCEVCRGEGEGGRAGNPESTPSFNLVNG